MSQLKLNSTRWIGGHRVDKKWMLSLKLIVIYMVVLFHRTCEKNYLNMVTRNASAFFQRKKWTVWHTEWITFLRWGGKLPFYVIKCEIDMGHTFHTHSIHIPHNMHEKAGKHLKWPLLPAYRLCLQRLRVLNILRDRRRNELPQQSPKWLWRSVAVSHTTVG